MASVLDTLSGSLTTHSEGIQLSFVSCLWKALMARKECLWPIVSKDPNPANSHVSLEAESPPFEPGVDAALANTLTIALSETLIHSTQLNFAQIPNPQKLSENKFVVLSLCILE